MRIINDAKQIARKTGQGRRGFTLIEIMIVVVIIGLLAGLVAVNLLPQAEKAKRTAARSQMKSLENALELYKLDTGRYPDALNALISPPGGQEPYLKGGKLPKDPWGNDFQYLSASDGAGGGKPYEIISLGADGQAGGSGEDSDVSNWGDDSN